MVKKRVFVIFLLLCLVLFFCVGCNLVDLSFRGKNLEYSQDVFAMDTYMTVTAYGPNAKKAVTEAVDRITQLEQKFSIGMKESEISLLNQKGRAVLSYDTFTLIKEAKEISELTQGAFDPTILPLMQLWGFTTGNFQIPSESEIEKTLLLVDGKQLKLKETTKEVLLSSNVKIDLGGIAKGYTSAEIMKIFKKNNVESGIVSLGGNVQTLGKKTDGSDFKIGIKDPNGKTQNDYLGVLNIHDKAVITSGGYERFFEKNGQIYHHILDPQTGYPVNNGMKAVTIVSENGTLSDGLSTALFVMGFDKAIEFWRAHKEQFDFIIVLDDDTIYISEGIKDCFSSEYHFSVIDK